MQRIDLGDDCLCPEREREREQQTGGGASERRLRQPSAEEGEQADSDRCPDRREEIQATGWIASAGRTDERRSQRVIERIRAARTVFGPQDRGLKSAGVAEIDARQERSCVGPERDRRNDTGRGNKCDVVSAFRRTVKA